MLLLLLRCLLPTLQTHFGEYAHLFATLGSALAGLMRAVLPWSCSGLQSSAGPTWLCLDLKTVHRHAAADFLSMFRISDLDFTDWPNWLASGAVSPRTEGHQLVDPGIAGGVEDSDDQKQAEYQSCQGRKERQHQHAANVDLLGEPSPTSTGVGWHTQAVSKAVSNTKTRSCCSRRIDGWSTVTTLQLTDWPNVVEEGPD
jgi:hypothetical protein